jgi:MFS family permease
MSTITFPDFPTTPDEPDPADDQAASGLRRKLAVARHDLAEVGDRVVTDAHGGADTVRGITAHLADIQHRIRTDPSPGRHRRISAGQRWLLRLLPLLDGAILWWFLVGVLNVDVRTPDPDFAIAVALALLATVALAAWAAIVGEHLARFVDDRRRTAWAAVDAVGWAMVVLTAAVWALLAAMMWVRVRDEVFQATGVLDAGGVVIAAALAAAVVVVNAYVLYLSWSDGSDETREAERLGRTLTPHLRDRQRLAHRVAVLSERVQAKEAARRATDRRRRHPWP